MNPRERVFKRLKGESVDRIPNLNIIMTFASGYIGVPYGKYTTDYRYLVEGNIKCCEKFGIDMVSAISDSFREAHDFGENIIIPEDDVPFCKDYPLKEYDDIKKLKVRGPLSGKRMLDRLRAVETYKKEVGHEYPVLGWVEGAFAELNDLRYINDVMVDLFDKPGFIKAALEICTEQAILFAVEQVKAGADFVGIGDAAASLIGPKMYEEFALPYEKRICSAIHAAGAKVKLHICGNISSLLDLVVKTGADMIDVDWMVDFKKAVQTFSGKSAACGNFDPVSVLLEGSINDVAHAVRCCVDAGDSTTFIAAGCEVPKLTPYKNMAAVSETLKSLSPAI